MDTPTPRNAPPPAAHTAVPHPDVTSPAAHARPFGAKFGPAHGRTGLPAATFGRRALATFVDVMVVQLVALLLLPVPLLAAALLLSSAGPLVAALVALAGMVGVPALVWLAVVTVPTGRFGRSLGKASAGLRVVDEVTGQPAGVARAVARETVRVASAAAFGLGFLAVMWDRLGRTWHDAAVRVVVVDERPVERGGVASGWLPAASGDPFAGRELATARAGAALFDAWVAQFAGSIVSQLFAVPLHMLLARAAPDVAPLPVGYDPAVDGAGPLADQLVSMLGYLAVLMSVQMVVSLAAFVVAWVAIRHLLDRPGQGTPGKRLFGLKVVATGPVPDPAGRARRSVWLLAGFGLRQLWAGSVLGRNDRHRGWSSQMQVVPSFRQPPPPTVGPAAS